MENKPINSEAFGYVRLHVPEKVNLDDFIIIEKFVCEMHNNFYPNGIYGDGDLRKYIKLVKLYQIAIGTSFGDANTIVFLFHGISWKRD